jgi:protein AIR1/2
LGKTDRAPREWEVNSLEWNDWGGRVPTNVGKQGKKKEMARMRAHQTELDNGDEDDRFTFLAKPMRDNEKKINIGNGKKAPSQPKKMRFEINVKGAAAKLEAESGSRTSFGRMNTDSSPLKRKEGDLLGRMSDNKKPRYRKDGGGRYDRDRSRDGDRHGEDKDHGREYSRREERGPRYRGGYSNSYHR